MEPSLADHWITEGYVHGLVADAADLDAVAEAWTEYRVFAEIADRLSAGRLNAVREDQ